MLPEIENIKRMRLSLGLTQSYLGKISCVSQSTIAKIESGGLDPSYSNAKKLFAALENLQRQSQKVARSIMNHHVISLRKTSSVFDAVRLMKEKGISQLPVIDAHKKILGSISEKSILGKIDEKPGINFRKICVMDILEDPFPTVSENTPATTIGHMLKDSLAIIVMKGEIMVGIITKSDLLKSV